MVSPVMERIKAIDVKDYHWALWCTVGGGPPHENPIVAARWTDDGRLSFMLDSHNFFSADPDEELELVRQDVSKLPASILADVEKRHRELLARRLTSEQLKRKQELLAERARIDTELRLLEVVDEDPLA